MCTGEGRWLSWTINDEWIQSAKHLSNIYWVFLTSGVVLGTDSKMTKIYSLPLRYSRLVQETEKLANSCHMVFRWLSMSLWPAWDTVGANSRQRWKTLRKSSRKKRSLSSVFKSKKKLTSWRKMGRIFHSRQSMRQLQRFREKWRNQEHFENFH